jgi:beta-propeller repeat-containing protein
MRFRFSYLVVFIVFLHAVTARAAEPADYGKIPLSFEKNLGQIDSKVKFFSRGPGYGFFLTDREAILRLNQPAPATVHMTLDGHSPDATLEAIDPLPGRTHYLKGPAQDAWHADLPTYGRVRYRGAYPGIDVVYYGNQRQLEYDVTIAPGARPEVVRFRFDGIKAITIDAHGDLVLKTAAGDIRQAKPSIYQEIEGKRVAVDGGYVLLAKRSVGFRVGDYDRGRPLVIDPTLVYSTFFGGTGLSDQGNAVAVDAAGNAYITGQTNSPDLFTVNGAQSKLSGSIDGYVIKVDPAGTTILYSTYFGGTASDEGHSIAVDAGGNAYITGFTTSSDFPIVNGFQRTRGGVQDAYVLKLNSTGSAIVFSTYLGGTADDRGYGITIDAGNNIYVTGITGSSNFPVLNPFQRTNAGGLDDVFVAKLNAAGVLVYSTFVGGVGVDHAYSIAVDSVGNAYVVGFTTSTNFPTVNPINATYSGGADDAIAFKLNAAGNGLVYSTYLGGNVSDEATRVIVDDSGSAYITGYTGSADFPTVNAYNATHSGNFDVFISKLAPDGKSLIFSTFFGGGGIESGTGIALGKDGAIYISGYTTSFDFPVINSYQETLHGDRDAFVAKFTPDASTVVFSTFIGGSGVDAAVGMGLDAAGNAIITGFTSSGDFPTATPFQGVSVDTTDTFITKINSADVVASSPFQIASQGGTSLKTAGTRGDLLFGYATAEPANSATQLTGLAILDFNKLGSAGTEVALMAPQLLIQGRMFVEVSSAVRSVISIVNPNDEDASVDFYFTDQLGESTKFVTVPIAAHGHFSRFVNDDPLLFDDPSIGTLNFTSTVPIAVSGFRTFVNENSEFLISSTPIADVLQVNTRPVTVPEWADGAGWNSEVVLVNTTENELGGEVRFLDPSGTPTEVGIDDGTTGASVVGYDLAPRSYQTISTSGTSLRADFPFAAKGTTQLKTPGTNFTQNTGYVTAESSAPVTGLQILEYRQNAVTHSATGLLATPPVLVGRLFVEVTNTIKTQLSIANPSSEDANVDLFFTDDSGNSTSFSSLTVGAGGQFTGNVGEGSIPIPGATGTISFTASVPVYVTALRIFTNENTLSIISPTPVANVNNVTTQALTIPHFADGGGWNSQIVLVNTTENPMSGEVRFRNPDGSPLEIAMSAGSGSVLAYNVPPRSFQRLDTAGTGDSASVGSIQVVPYPVPGNFTPFAYAQLNLKDGPATVMQNVVQGQIPASRLRIYAEAFGDFDNKAGRSTRTAIALANPSSSPVTVSLELSRLDGTATRGRDPIVIPANGQFAAYVDSSLFPSNPAATAPFQGIVTVTAPAGVTAVGFRAMNNERGDFLTATTGPLNEQAASANLIFPYMTDGGGYTSQFIAVGPAAAFSGVIHFIAQDGTGLYIDDARVGSVQIVPYEGTYTPASHIVLTHRELGIAKLQTYVEGGLHSSSLRIFTENLPGFETGVLGSARASVALANPGSTIATVRLDLVNFSGALQASTSVQIPPNGEFASSLTDLPGFGSIPPAFQGLLKMTVLSGSGITATGFRNSYNANGNLLATTTGPLVENAGVPGLLIFPHIAEGGGYVTRFIIVGSSSGQGNSGVLSFFNDTGAPVNLVLTNQ